MKDNFSSRKKLLNIIKGNRDTKDKNLRAQKKALPDNYFTKCPSCEKVYFRNNLVDNLFVCPSCGIYLTYPIKERLDMLFDELKPMEKRPKYDNPIDFPNYKQKLKETAEKSGQKEAISWGQAKLDGRDLVYFAMDPSFIMASMGTYVGEQVALAFEYAMKKKLPLVGISASGGARMQEGIMSLMQMSKAMGVIERFRREKLLYISILTHPTTGGVTASFALQGDINIGEPGALIGFAGPRVIKETTGKELPKGFQSSEFLVEKGFLDMVLAREEQRETLKKILALHERRS